MAKKEAKKAPAKKPVAAKKAAPKPVKEAKAPKAKAEKKAAKPVEVEEESTTEVVETPAEKPAKAAKPPKEKKMTKAAIAAAKFSSDENKKWNDLREKYVSEKPSTYSMTATFEANRPIQHKVLGWGYIVSVQNDRLEVLFETGTKMLISNYKG